MKKRITTLTAAAVAMVGTAAYAEDSLEFYGIISTGLAYEQVQPGESVETQQQLGFDTGQWMGSRFGVRGNYRVTDSLVTVFTLEGGYNSTSGQQSQGRRLFGRELTAGLQIDGIGTLEVGRMNSAATQVLYQYDPFIASFGTSSLTSSFGASFSRWDNTIRFQSEDLSGVTLHAAYSFDPAISSNSNSEGSGYETSAKDRALSLGLNYETGPTAIGVVYDRYFSNEENTGSGAINNDTDMTAYGLAATHDFGSLTLHGFVGREENGIVGALGGVADILAGDSSANGSTLLFADGVSRVTTMLGATIPLASGDLRVGLQTAELDAGSQHSDDGADTQRIVSLAYTQELSDRFGWYAYTSVADNLNMVEGAESFQIGSGIRVNF